MKERKTKTKNNYKKVTLSPFINRSSTFSTFLLIFIAILPQVLMLFITKSFDNLVILATCVVACLLSEVFSLIKRENVSLSILTSLLHGTLISFFLPASYPPVSIFFITLIVKLFIKYGLKDSYSSWLNPVAVTVIFCWFIGQFNFPEFQVTHDLLSTKNPSLSLIQDGVFPTFKFDESITSFLNESVFSFLGVTIPQGYVSLIWDTGSVIPAFRFNFLTILASVFLVSMNVFSIDVPLVFLFVYSLLVKYLVPLVTSGIQMYGDMILALFSSGTLFCAFILLQWFGTTPMTKQGKILYGFLGGIFAFLFSGCGTSPIGSVITILFLNLISPIIQYFENKYNRIKISNTLRNENA